MGVYNELHQTSWIVVIMLIQSSSWSATSHESWRMTYDAWRMFCTSREAWRMHYTIRESRRMTHNACFAQVVSHDACLMQVVSHDACVELVTWRMSHDSSNHMYDWLIKNSHPPHSPASLMLWTTWPFFSDGIFEELNNLVLQSSNVHS